MRKTQDITPFGLSSTGFNQKHHAAICQAVWQMHPACNFSIFPSGILFVHISILHRTCLIPTFRFCLLWISGVGIHPFVEFMPWFVVGFPLVRLVLGGRSGGHNGKISTYCPHYDPLRIYGTVGPDMRYKIIKYYYCEPIGSRCPLSSESRNPIISSPHNDSLRVPCSEHAAMVC